MRKLPKRFFKKYFPAIIISIIIVVILILFLLEILRTNFTWLQSLLSPIETFLDICLGIIIILTALILDPFLGDVSGSQLEKMGILECEAGWINWYTPTIPVMIATFILIGLAAWAINYAVIKIIEKIVK